jgi:hypothetical protein
MMSQLGRRESFGNSDCQDVAPESYLWELVLEEGDQEVEERGD